MKTRNHISKSIICLLMVVLCIAAFSACRILFADQCNHEWSGWTVTKDATCEVAGVRSRTCEQCGETETAPIEATGHKWAEATCTAPKTCTVCNKTEGSVLAHVYDEEIVKDEALKSAATEENAAVYYKSCSCGAISKNDAETFAHGAPLNHEHTYTSEVTAPTCTTEGYTTYTCKCGDTYTDNETAVLGHEGGQATCTELAKCEVCGLEYGELLAHSWVDATCTKEKYCSACGLTEGEKLAHTGGTASCTELAKCEVCGLEYGELLAHSWVDATCIKEKHCSACGLTEGEKLAHTGGTATCTEQAKCDVCGNAYGAFGAHDWKDATCTEAKNCRLCGSFEGEALGHTGGTATCTNKAICERCSMAYGETVVHTYDKNADPLRYLAKEATCEGADEYYYSCSACGKCHDGEGAETFFDGEALEHDYVWVSNGDNTHTGTCQNGCNSTVTDTCTGGTATCTQKAVCEICQEYYGEALGHTWVDGEIITAPTCTSAGQKEQTCACGVSTTVSVPALQHSYSETTVDPSCLAQGYTVYTCEGCGHSYQGNYQNALGHSFGEWTVTKAATCTENGVQTHACGCGAVETQVILASGHNHVATVTAPTCVQKGYTTYTCSCGDSYVGDETAPAGHAWNIDAPTCTEDQVCDTCGERVDALGHDHKLSGSTAATCVAAATNTYTCEQCGHSYTESVGTAIAHNIQDVTPELILNEGETCLYTEHYTCKDCGADVVGETVEKHEKYTASIQTAATCITEGIKILTCAECDYTKEEIIPIDTTLGHTWEIGTISDGKRTDTCACGETKVVTVVTGDQANKVDDLKDTELSIGDANINFGDAADSIGDQTNNDVTVGAGTLDDDEKKDVLDDLDEEKLGQIGNNPIYNFTVTDTENNLITDFGGKEVTITIPYKLAEGEDVDSIAIWFINDKGEVESIPATYNNDYVTFTTNHFSYYTVTKLTPAQRCEVYGHNFKESIVAPTCTAQGYTLQYCIRCRHSQMVNYVDALDHKYEAQTVKTANCTENGLIRYTCSTCKEFYEEIIPAIKHNYEFFSETKGSCTVAGVITYKCTNCQGTKTEQTTTTGHSCVAVQTVASTCTTQGYTVYACQNEGCDYSYNGDYQAVVDHSFGEWVITQASTCTVEGEERRQCANCEHYETKKIAVVPHNYVATVTEPTCDQIGYTTYTCSLCQNAYEDSVTDPIGHKYDATWDWADDKATATITITCQHEGCQYNGTPITRQINSECTVFDSTVDKEGRKEYHVHFEFDGHSFSDEKQEIIPVKEHSHEGCEMQYNKFNHWYKCPDCKGNSGKIPHEFDEGTVVKEATCKTEGEIVYKCKCGYESFESIPKNDNHTAGTEFYRDGLTHWNICAECGEKLNEVEHAWDGGTLTKNVTCTENGIITYRCACGAGKAEEIPALGHTEKQLPAIAPTCTESGLTAGVICETCGEVLVKQEIIEALGHTEKQLSAIDPTCTESGLTAGVMCEVCGEILVEQEVVPALGHTEEILPSISATCTESGITEGKKCAVCGEILVAQQEIPATGHSFGEWIETIAPTEEAAGEKTRYCANCDATETSPIAALGHVHELHPVTVLEAVAATCTKNGLTAGEMCSGCGEVLVPQEMVPALGHKEDILAGKDATCGKIGLTEGTWCSACGEIFVEQEEIPATGNHTYENGYCIICGYIPPVSCEKHSYETDLLTNPARFEKTWGICTVCGYVDDNHEHRIEGGKCVYCDYTFEYSEVASVFDNDGDGNNDVYFFAAALPEQFNDAIRIDAFKDAASEGNHIEYDEIRAGYLDKYPNPMPYPHVYCSDLSANELIYTIYVEEAGTYEMAVHLRIKDNRVRGAKYVINKGTENEYAFSTSYEWSSAEDAYAVRNNDLLIGAYMYGITIELQAGKNTIHITNDESIVKPQHFRDFYLVPLDTCAHEYTEIEKVEPTCTTDGYVTKVCGLCGKTTTKKLSVLDHTFGEFVEIKAPTCTEMGEMMATCTVCGEAVIEYIPVLSHTFGEFVETKAPTCIEYGEMMATCTVCGATTFEYIPALGHNIQDGICTICGRPAFCDTHDYGNRFEKKWGICVVCGYVDDNHEHSIADGKCVYCDYEFEVIEVSSTFDNDGDGVVDVFYFSAALPEEFTGEDVIWLDAFNGSTGSHMEYDEIRAGSGSLPYPHVYCYDQDIRQSITFTFNVETAGLYNVAVHYRIKDHKVRGAKFIVNAGTENEQVINHTYGWATADDAYEVRNNDFLIGAYMTGLVFELQEGENTITILVADGVQKAQHFRDLYLVSVDGCKHEYAEIEKVEPTCTTDGYVTKVCGLCEKVKTTKLPAFGHTPGEFVETKAPTCTEMGEMTATCIACGEAVIEYIPVLSHTFGEFVETKAPTCIEYGEMVATCTVCGATTFEYIPALGHNIQDGICTICGRPASCETHDYGNRFEKKWGICVVCGYVDDNHEHSIADGKCVYCDYEFEVIEVSSTFDNDGDGVVDVFYFSAALPEEFTGEDVIWLDAFNGSTGSHMEYDEIRAGSGSLPYPHVYCYDQDIRQSITFTFNVETAGLYNVAVHYRIKDHKVRGAKFIVNAGTENEQVINHTYGWATADDAYEVRNNDFLIGAYMTGLVFELQEGENTITILVADGVQKAQHFRDLYLVSVDGCKHEYTEIEKVEPTCTTDGYVTKVCGLCEKVKTTKLPATGHIAGEWTVTVEPTCTTEGQMSTTCTVCGETVLAVLPAFGHSFGNYTETVAPTCTEYGEWMETCYTCGAAQTGILYPLGHRWDTWEDTKLPTCTENGERVYHCACGETMIETLWRYGHAFTDIVITKEATCTEDGEQVGTCINCGETITEILYATGHYETYERIYLSDLGITCGGYVRIYTCRVCGENTNNRFSEYCAWFDSGIDEATGAHIYTCSYCGAVKHELFETQYTDVACKYTVVETRTYYVAGEAVLTVISQTYHEDHEWQYEFVLNGTSCEDGYTVKETCKTCDWLREFVSYDHAQYRVEYYDFTEYGACRGYLELTACPCGEYTGRSVDHCASRTVSNESYVDENGVEHVIYLYQCSTCGLTRTRDRYYEDEGCYTYRYYIYTFNMGETYLGSYTEKSQYSAHHEYEYTYTFLDETNKNCEAGVTVIEICRNCDHVSEWTDYGHNTRRVAYYDFAKYGACYGYLEVYSCACGQEGWSNANYCAYNFVSSDSYTDEAGFEHRVEVYECPNCGLKRTSDYYEVRVGCYTYRYYTESYAIGETEIGTARWKSQYREHHEYEYTYTFRDEANKNCDAGVTIVTTCKNCDYRSQSTRAYHQNNTLFYSDWYDCCDNHNVQVSGCPCGEQFNIQFNDYTFNYNEETQTYTCENCALTVSKVLEVTENGCSRTETTTFVACLSGAEKYRSVKEEICANHSYGDVKVSVSEETTIASAKCSKCGDEVTFEMQQAILEYHEGSYYYDYTFTPEISAMFAIQSYSNGDTYVTLYELVDGRLIELASNDDGAGNVQFYLATNLEAGKTYVYRIRFLNSSTSGTIAFTLTQYAMQATTNCKHNSAKEFAVLTEGATSCTDGVFRGNLCPECGRLTQTQFSTSHNTYRIAYYDLREYGACHGYLEIYSCACGYNQQANANYCANSTVSSETFVDENGVEHTVTVYQCPTCGLTRTRDRYYEDEGCYTYRYYIYTFTMGEVEIASYTTKSQNSTHHEYEYTYTFADEANKNCEAGVTIVTTCKNCDYHSESYYTRHATFRTEYYDFTEYGACYGYLEVYSCACGQETGINRSYCSHNHVSNSNYVDEAGVKHYVDVYGCPTCGLTRTCDYYDQREGCDIYRYYTESYTIGETEIGSGSYKSHYDTRHEYEHTYTFADEANQNCEAGVTVVTTCKNCDYHRESYYTSHVTFQTEYYDFTEYGADGGYAYVNTCACGYSTNVNFMLCSHGSNYNTNEYTDEEGIRWYVETWTTSCDCNIRFDRAYRYEHDTENCLRTYYYEESLSVGNALIDFGARTTSEVYHEYEIRVELMEGSTDCNQGVIVIHDCRYCDEQYTNNVYHHYNAEIARFNLTQYGAVCEGYAVINGCACGYNRSLSISDSDCAFEHRSTVNWVEGTLHGVGLETAEGYRSFHSYSYTYTCAVTDPTQCGFAIRYSTYWRKNADCSASKYLTVQFGYDEATGTCQHEVTYEFAGQTYTYHNYERTNVDNGYVDTCPDCGSYYSLTNYYNEQGIHIKQQEIWENKLDDGCNKYREYTYEYAGTHEGRWGNYQTSSYHKYIDANGVETWEKYEYSYAEYEAPFGENGYIRTEKYSNSSEYSYTYEYTYTDYKGYQFTLCVRRTEGDYWWQDAYTYDFTNGCKRVHTYTNSGGANTTYAPEDAHPTWYYQTVTPPTCTQYGVRGHYCPVCDAHWDDQPVSPIGHNWVLLFDNLYYCRNCGLQNINGANGDIVMEDLTEKYGNGEAYVIGYWKNTTVRFTPYVMIYLNEPMEIDGFIEEAFLLFLMDDQFHFVEDEYVGLYVTVADIQAAVEMLCQDYGIDTFTPDMYAVSISFVPDGADDNFDYAIVFDNLPGSEDADNTIQNNEFVVDYVFEGGYIEYTIISNETAEWIFESHVSGGDPYAHLFDANGRELMTNDDGAGSLNFRITYTLQAGVTYVLRVRWLNNQTAGYIATSFQKGHVHTIVEETPAIAPTCTTEGWTASQRCSECGVIAYQQYIPPLGHAAGDWTVDYEATCTASGQKSATCTVCGETVYDWIPPLGHALGEWVETIAPTCGAYGERKATCSVCNENTYEWIFPLAHTLGEWVETIAPTCTVNGERQAVCSVCGSTTYEWIAPLGHTIQDGICTVCGQLPSCETEHSYEVDLLNNAQRFEKTWGVCTVCGYVDDYHTHKVENGKCVYCDYEFSTSDVTSAFDSDGDGALDVYKFSAALPEKFNDAIRLDAFKDSTGNHWEYDEVRASSGTMPYAHVYCGDGVATDHITYTVNVEKAGIYEVAVHIRLKDQRERGATFVINEDTAYEQKIAATYSWATADEAMMVRDSDYLQSAYYTGLSFELQAGENTIAIKVADGVVKTQHFRDLYLVWSADLPADGEEVAPDLPYIPEDSFTAVGGSDNNTAYYYDSAAANSIGKIEVVEE